MTLDAWLDAPDNRRTFQRVDEIVPIAPIGRGTGPVREFAARPIDGLIDDDRLERNYVDGLLVLQGDAIVFERYLNGLEPGTRHSLMSVSKSIGGMAAGRLVGRGALDLAARVDAIVPELAGTAYGDALVQHLLDMTVAVSFDHAYADPRSDVQTEDRAGGWRPRLDGDPADTRDFLQTLQAYGPPGEGFEYCSATTDVLAWVMERAGGKPYPELLSELVWSEIGAEHDAFVTVDPSGVAYACAGMCATLRDVARFGRLVLDGTWNAAWVEETRHGGGPSLASSPDYADSAEQYPDAVYHNKWWITRGERGGFYGVGIFGQYLWLDPQANVVIAMFASLPAPLLPETSAAHFALLDDVLAGVS